MDEKLVKLRQQVHAKTMEIEAFVAKQEGMSDLKDMDPAVYQRLRSHVEKLLEEWEEAVHEGILSGDEESPFIKLARERIEIEQQIANLQERRKSLVAARSVNAFQAGRCRKGRRLEGRRPFTLANDSGG